MSEILNAVCLALHAKGPLTLNDLHFLTLLPYPTLRTHLHLHQGERYEARSEWCDGVRVRRWSLMPPKTVDMP